jgi:hypothetical protein
MKKGKHLIWAWAIVWIVPTGVQAQTLRLQVNPPTLSFGFHLPSTMPVVRADQPILINFDVEDDNGEGWRITVIADGDLIGEGRSIPVNEIHWTATPSPPFVHGSLSRDTPQIVAQGIGPARGTGTLRFTMRDRWDYYPGDYSQSLQFVLSSP